MLQHRIQHGNFIKTGAAAAAAPKWPKMGSVGHDPEMASLSIKYMCQSVPKRARPRFLKHGPPKLKQYPIWSGVGGVRALPLVTRGVARARSLQKSWRVHLTPGLITIELHTYCRRSRGAIGRYQAGRPLRPPECPTAMDGSDDDPRRGKGVIKTPALHVLRSCQAQPSGHVPQSHPVQQRVSKQRLPPRGAHSVHGGRVFCHRRCTRSVVHLECISRAISRAARPAERPP